MNTAGRKDPNDGSRPLAVALLCLLAIAGTALAQSPPASFTANFTNGASVVTVNFTLHSIRSPNFSVVVQNSSGGLNSYTAPAAATYLGTPVGYSGALACATLKNNGTLLARIMFEDGTTWTAASGTTAGGAASGSGSPNWTRQWPTFTISGGAGTNQYAAEVGIDSSWSHFNRSALDVNDNLSIIEHSVLCANVLYLRDAGILHRIGRVVIRAAQGVDPYNGLTSGALLNETANQWNNVLPPSTHDVTAMVSASSVGGGLAWVGVIGTGNRYSVNDSDGNGDFSEIWRHEVGHNWGSSHYEGGGKPEGPTIMSDNSLSRISSPELSKILAHRNTKLDILDNLGAYSFPLPPRASMERVSVATGDSVTIDVLDNDHDGNGNGISIQSFDATSNLGGTVSRSVGTGPGGRDQLILQTGGGSGKTNWFNYRIVDTTGRTATGIVYATNTAATPPAALSGLVASRASSTSVYLSWTASGGASSYKVKRATVSGGPYTIIATPTGTSYSDTGLVTGTTYYYVVSAVNIYGESANSAQASATPVTPTLTGGWTFNYGSGTIATDSSGYGNNGTLNGAATWVTGFSGTALQFDGVNSSVTFGTGPSVSGLNDFTVSAWIKTTAATAGQIIQQRDSGFNGEYMLTMNANGTVQFTLYGDSAYQFDFATTGAVNNGAWHHVVAVRSGLVGNIYIDGNPTPEGTATGTAVRNLAASIGTYLARDVRDNNLNFNGSIDEVRIYKTTALSGSEVQSLYNSYFGPPPPPAPTALAATGGNAVVNLTWTQSTGTGITGNNIYRSTTGSGGPYSLLVSLPATTSHSDTNVVNGNTYFFKVSAVNANGESAQSAYQGATPVAPVRPVVTSQPASQTAVAGTTITLSVTASGSSPLTFQWRLNGTNLPIATNSVLNVFFTGTNQSGNYSVVVSNSGGSVTSTSALLTVIPSGTYFASLVQGVAQITLPGIPGAVAPLSLDWVPIATGDADTPDPSTFAMARMYGFGRVLMLGHNGLLSNPTLLNNQQFMLNTIAWLDSFGSKRVAYTSAHGEALNSGNLSSLANILTNRGYTFGPLANPLTAASLRSVGVLIVGNAWGSFTSAEIDAVRAYVAAGGGVALVGLGWSWIAYHPTTTMNDYPMAKMAQPFGATWLDNYISDPTDQLDGSPIFHMFYPNTDFGPTPSLEATVVSNSIALAWPASVPGFVLETTTSLSSPWSAVTSVTNIVGVKWNVSQPTLEGRRFYRLRGSGP